MAKESSSQEDASSINGISSDVEQIKISASEEENREPEALGSQVQVNGENEEEMTNDVLPSTGEANGLAQTQDSQQNDDDPQIPLADFDWAEFEDRYRISMESANGKQDALLNEFENLIKVSLSMLVHSTIADHSLVLWDMGRSVRKI